MPTMIANRSEPSPDGRLPVSPDTFHPSLDDLSASRLMGY